MARQVKVKQVQQAPLHPDLQYDEGTTPVEKQAANQPNPELEQMKAQIAEMRASLEQQRAANVALMSQPVVNSPPQVRTTLDTANLPDPTMEPEKYASEL